MQTNTLTIRHFVLPQGKKKEDEKMDEKETETQMKERKVKGRWGLYIQMIAKCVYAKERRIKTLFGMTMKTFPIECANAYTE